MTTFISTLRIHPCKKCQSKDVFCEKTLEEPERQFVICSDCGESGADGVSYQEAITLWNHPPKNVKAIRRYKEY